MNQVKTSRPIKRQLGQFMTPVAISSKILSSVKFMKTDKVLEPCFGDGSFLIGIIELFMPLYDGTIEEKLDQILSKNIWGVELDKDLYNKAILKILDKWGYLPQIHNLTNGDFLKTQFSEKFSYVIGNPPFGGTFEPKDSKRLERLYGSRQGMKIKKETYSFFIVKSVEHLDDYGHLIFICSDTLMTIKTHKGLRNYLMNTGYVRCESLSRFSDETSYPMIVLKFNNLEDVDWVEYDSKIIRYKSILKTANLSWSIDDNLSKYFRGKSLSDFITCSGGLTTGKNEYFIREIQKDKIIETYDFSFYLEEISIGDEIGKSKNGYLSDAKIKDISERKKAGHRNRNVRIEKVNPYVVKLPNENYKYYNVSDSNILWADPSKVIYWKDNGDAVLTYKKNGKWYLQGFGGGKFHGREGFTWSLISSKINARYLPSDYIIDNSSPIAVLKPGIDRDELYFIMAWCLTDICNMILKKVINKTRNIQNKDVERLPYPSWVSKSDKLEIIELTRNAIIDKMGSRLDEKDYLEKINTFFNLKPVLSEMSLN